MTFRDIYLQDIEPEGLLPDTFHHFEVNIKPVRQRFALELGDVRAMINDSPRLVDRSLLQFLELALSQHINLHP